MRIKNNKILKCYLFLFLPIIEGRLWRPIMLQTQGCLNTIMKIKFPWQGHKTDLHKGEKIYTLWVEEKQPYFMATSVLKESMLFLP